MTSKYMFHKQSASSSSRSLAETDQTSSLCPLPGKQPRHPLARASPGHVRALSEDWRQGVAATYLPPQQGFKMLSLKLPRVFSIDQMPQVGALTPVVAFQVVMRIWPLPQGDWPSASLLSSRSSPQTPRGMRASYSPTYTKSGMEMLLKLFTV